ncbi:MAG TPA: 50S ribosomal protein L29 [Bryobacterales bacterium]|jgi:large subunit ribosomal protein L29|nr:50S ribosomal protein L29 [Bryobacterales bacterium]
MSAEKIRELDDRELAHQLAETQDKLFRLRFQMSMGQTDGLKRYRELKKERARMLTVQRQRELSK